MKAKKNIAIFFWESYISVAPTIINLADALAEKGHKIFIFIRNVDYVFAPETILNKNVIIVPISQSSAVLKFIKVVNKIPWVRGWFQYKYYNRIILYDVIRKTQVFLKENITDNDCIGVDSIGLFWASKLINEESVLYYLSLELLCKSAIPRNSYFLKWIKEKELRLHNNKVKLTLIQDKFRLNILERENEIILDNKFSILTNSPRENNLNFKKDSLYFNQKFQILPGEKIILMAGMIEEVTMATSVARTFGKFNDENVKLIFHERQQRDPGEQYFQDLQKIGGKNFYLSLTPVPYSDVTKVYDSADIGLVFYDPSYGDNVAFIIGASGKLSHYLMHGLPVIANDLPGFRELFEKYDIGFVLNEIHDLEDAVDKIFLNYKYYSDNAYNCYLSEYNFNSQFEKFYVENYPDCEYN